MDPSRTVEVVDAENKALRKQTYELELKLKRLEKEPPKPKADPAELKAVEQKYEKYLNAYKKRKRLCKDMIDTIMESYPGTQKKLVDDIGIETDEDVGFVFTDLNASK